jgi:hypothetical protein
MVYLADGATANNLTDMLMGSLEVKGGLDKEVVASKLICFGADGCSVFQGSRNGITIQIQKKLHPLHLVFTAMLTRSTLL